MEKPRKDKVRRCSLIRPLLHRPHFVNYRKHAKGYSRRFKHRDPYEVFVRTFFKEAHKHIVESVGGMYLKGLGYFGVLMLPEKMFLENKYGRATNFNLHTDNYSYRLIFYPEQKAGTMLPMFGMERTFSSPLKAALTKRLRSGVKYKTYIYTIQSFWRKWKPLSLNDLEQLKDIDLDEYTSFDRGDQE